jgi:hypothetical protein
MEYGSRAGTKSFRDRSVLMFPVLGRTAFWHDYLMLVAASLYRAALLLSLSLDGIG